MCFCGSVFRSVCTSVRVLLQLRGGLEPETCSCSHSGGLRCCWFRVSLRPRSRVCCCDLTSETLNLRWLLGDKALLCAAESGSLLVKTPFVPGEMSAVSSDHIQTGEQSRVESDDQEGILQPQTVFVILDSAETLNLVRWVRKFLDIPNSLRKSTDLKSLCFSSTETNLSEQDWGQGLDLQFVLVNSAYHS